MALPSREGCSLPDHSHPGPHPKQSREVGLGNTPFYRSDTRLRDLLEVSAGKRHSQTLDLSGGITRTPLLDEARIPPAARRPPALS